MDGKDGRIVGTEKKTIDVELKGDPKRSGCQTQVHQSHPYYSHPYDDPSWFGPDNLSLHQPDNLKDLTILHSDLNDDR